MREVIRVALESAIRTYEAMSPGVMTAERKQAIDALQALQSGEPDTKSPSYSELLWIVCNVGMATRMNEGGIIPQQYLNDCAKIYAETRSANRSELPAHPQPVVPEEHVVLKLKDALMLQINIHDQLKGGNLGMNGNRLASSGQALGKAIIKARHLLSAGKETGNAL